MEPLHADPSLEELSATVVAASLRVYHDLGPGLLESVYERLLQGQLARRGLDVRRQHPVDFTYDGEHFAAAFRADLLVERRLLVEVKAVEAVPPIAVRQTVTYLRLLGLPLGLLINFGSSRFSVRRVVNGHRDTRGSRLRIHRGDG